MERLVGRESVQQIADEFVIEATMHGESAKELNRALLSEIRRVEKKTTLRA
jgi:polyhydroxyalkanoate synthesis regulator phasin